MITHPLGDLLELLPERPLPTVSPQRHLDVLSGLAGAAIDLGSPSPPVVDVEVAMRERTARREYENAPLPLADLAAVVDAAESGAASLPTASADLVLFVVARNVEGCSPAIYELAGRRLVAVAPVPADRLDSVVLQGEMARASAIVVIAGTLAGACAQLGVHGHRLLHLRAGLAAHGAWLAAEQRLLAGCAFSGILPSFLRQAGLADGFRTASLFAFAVGPRPSMRPGLPG